MYSQSPLYCATDLSLWSCGKQLWFLQWLTLRSAAGIQHHSGMKITRDQWKVVARPEPNIQRSDTINTVLTGLFILIRAPDKPKLGFECFSFILRCCRDRRATAGFHTDGAHCKRSATVAKGASQILWHLKRGCGKGRGEPTGRGGVGSC